jgi:hypothetical protein
MLAGQPPSPHGRWLRFVAFALVAGYLIFCHGCHADEDTELFAKSGSLKW